MCYMYVLHHVVFYVLPAVALCACLIVFCVFVAFCCCLRIFCIMLLYVCFLLLC